MRVLVLLAVIACGAPPDAPAVGLQLEPGSYALHAYQRDHEGSCEWVGEIHEYISVGTDHAVTSPLPGVFDCRTDYVAPRAINISCRGLGNTLEANGELDGAAWAMGQGEARGNVSGCRRWAFAFTMYREDP